MTAPVIVNAMFAQGLGGIEQALLDYNEALLLAGYEVHALIHSRAALRPALEKQRVHVHAISNWGSWDLLAALRIKQLLRKLTPALGIAHGNRAVDLLTQAKGNMPLVAVAHNYKIHLQGSSVFCPTRDLMRHAEGQGVTPKQIFHVPNMVRPPAHAQRPAWQSPPVIGTMGRFVAKKGFAVFIEAIALLKSRGIVFRAVLAGDGEEASTLKALAKTKGVEDMLSFPGWIEDTQAFFADTDIFCLPSLHEPFGIVLLEAMAQGLPVVATHSEGPGEILRDGFDGVLVPKSDAAALADALQTVLSHPANAVLMGYNAAETVRKHYALPVVAEKLDLAVRAVATIL